MGKRGKDKSRKERIELLTAVLLLITELISLIREILK